MREIPNFMDSKRFKTPKMENSGLPATLIWMGKYSTLGGKEPWLFKVNKPGIQADKILRLSKLLVQSPFSAFSTITVRKIGEFPHFLSALASNNQLTN